MRELAQCKLTTAQGLQRCSGSQNYLSELLVCARGRSAQAPALTSHWGSRHPQAPYFWIVQTKTPHQPTPAAYAELQEAFEFFNAALYQGQLPNVLIILDSSKRSKGYFCAERYVHEDGTLLHALALNPVYFATSPIEDTLSTIVHEMAHLWQHVAGKPGRRGYHNKEWADHMAEQLGLQPSRTGQPGGKSTGEHMDHYVVEGGPFIRHCRTFLARGFRLRWYDRFLPAVIGEAVQTPADVSPKVAPEAGVAELSKSAGLPQGVEPLLAARNRSHRVKYVCEHCDVAVWGRAGLLLSCGICKRELAAVLA